jgi:hypothetical protein
LWIIALVSAIFLIITVAMTILAGITPGIAATTVMVLAGVLLVLSAVLLWLGSRTRAA